MADGDVEDGVPREVEDIEESGDGGSVIECVIRLNTLLDGGFPQFVDLPDGKPVSATFLIDENTLEGSHVRPVLGDHDVDCGGAALTFRVDVLAYVEALRRTNHAGVRRASKYL
jgi:hypothetical protein